MSKIAEAQKITHAKITTFTVPGLMRIGRGKGEPEGRSQKNGLHVGSFN